MCSEENYFSLPTSDSASDQAPILHRNQDVIIVKLIGKRLYINGFVYIKNHTDAKNKVHWECRRYRKQKCHARAITSDPTLDENIVLFRGLEESPHDHKPSPQEVEEAEETAKSGNEWKRKSQLLDGTFSGSGSDSKTRMSIEVPQQETISNGIAKEIETDQSITKQSVQLTARKETSNLGK
ncbi:hypothetical protein QAD02_006760 [Eretmocerus hayati]|uniref:Uncharacterized protein n=1 Tax=Eretmocerus hayati TaxID=131215 RepID=A0ACC2N288_9HYME|nr:hypothetical protein QAD02_006760 [Eretmocerus hayati]